MIKRAPHPSGKTIIFEEDRHVYYIDGDEDTCFVSGTTFLHKFAQPFDRDAVSLRYAQKHGLDQQEVLKQWEEKGRIARDNGTAVHNFAENLVLGKPVPLDSKNEKVHRMQKQAIYAISELEERFDLIETEKVVAHLPCKIAGMVDLIGREKKTGVLWILDYKTNKRIDLQNQWQIMKPPINHLQQCNYNEYSLQMNLYRWIMNEEKYFQEQNYKQALIHITEDQWQLIECPDRQKEIKLMVDCYMQDN